MSAAENTTLYGEIRYNARHQKWIVDKLAPHVSLRFKSLFPRVAEGSLPPFSLTHSMDVCADLEWFMMRYPLSISDKDRQRMEGARETFYEHRAATEAILKPDWTPNPVQGLREGCTFRNKQDVAVDYQQAVKRLLLVDPIGSGKSYTAIGSVLAHQQAGGGMSAFVVQPHLPKQFKEKIEAFSHLTVHIIKSKKPYSLPPADVYIFKYTIMAGWIDLFAQGWFDHVVFDEVQEVRHGVDTSKGASAKVLADHAGSVLATTATPIYGFGIEFFNVMNIISPGVLGTRQEFTREWCDHDDKRVKDPDALGTYLREARVMLRRTKEDVYGKESNPNIVTENVDYDEKLVKSAEDLAKQLAITTLTGTFTERGQAARELDLRLRQATGIAKATNVARFVRMLVESGEPVILSGWHRDVYEIWQRELGDLGVSMYTGTESPAQKARSVDDFIAGRTKVLILSHRSGAGLDGIQKVCSTVVIGELAWSKELHEQIIGRADREGQLRPVTGFIMTSDYGSDPVMMDLLGIKHSQQQGVLDPGKRVTKVNSDRGRMVQLAQSFLADRGVPIPEPESALEPVE